MDVVLICFSQTGNTRKVATAMAGAFWEVGRSARTISLKEATPEDATKGDLLGVGTPCFSSRAPTPIKEFLRALPPLDDQRAFVFATSGGVPGGSIRSDQLVTQQRGGCARRVSGPWTSASSCFPYGRPVPGSPQCRRFDPRPTLRRSRGRTCVGRTFWSTARKQARHPKAGVGFLRLGGVGQCGHIAASSDARAETRPSQV